MPPEFCERFSPSDASFMGAPIDYVIFDGLHRGEVDQVIFLEIKSGRSDLNKNEREVRQAIEERRVAFEVLSLGDGSPRRRLNPPGSGRVLEAKRDLNLESGGRPFAARSRRPMIESGRAHIPSDALADVPSDVAAFIRRRGCA